MATTCYWRIYEIRHNRLKLIHFFFTFLKEEKMHFEPRSTIFKSYDLRLWFHVYAKQLVVVGVIGNKFRQMFHFEAFEAWSHLELYWTISSKSNLSNWPFICDYYLKLLISTKHWLQNGILQILSHFWCFNLISILWFHIFMVFFLKTESRLLLK